MALIDKETIRKEIERRLSLIYLLKGDFTDGSRDAYEGLLSWLDTLPEQPEVELENNGWIDCGKQMPKETKQWSDTLQGHREWTESDLVLAWDSMYGCRVDATKNGKWMSEQRGGYAGQIVHGIIAWRPIPEFNEELLFNAGNEKKI
jgi:hypothetical protein